MLVCWLIVVDFLVIFSSSKDDTPADTPAPWHPFSKLTLLAQQLSSSVSHLGRAVQAASVRLSSSLSRSGSGGEARPGKFNFWAGTKGVGDKSSGGGHLEAAWSLSRPSAESPSDISLVGGTRVKKE